MCPRFDPGSGHHFFALMPFGHPERLFLCLYLRLNCKDLSLFWQNGEFEKSAFRRDEIRKNPPNSPFGDFRGHGNLTSCKCLIYKENALKYPVTFLFLQWMQWRIWFYKPSSFECFLWQSKSYKKIRDFCFHHKCTPEYRYCGVIDCCFAFSRHFILCFNGVLFYVFAENRHASHRPIWNWIPF